jgi:hypothetical protein
MIVGLSGCELCGYEGRRTPQHGGAAFQFVIGVDGRT